MFEVRYTYTFPTAWTEPYLLPQEFYDRVQAYHATNRVFQEKTYSDDGFELVTRQIWSSKETFQNYMDDEIITEFRNTRKQYNIDNNIYWKLETGTINSLDDDVTQSSDYNFIWSRNALL